VRILVVVLALALVVAVLGWIGERRRQSCVNSGRTGCTILYGMTAQRPSWEDSWKHIGEPDWKHTTP
jgi:hypothetical protein